MKIIKDICYNDKDQLLDLLLPENDVYAVLVFFHGGGIVEGCKEWNRVPFEYLTSKNIAVASANYRMYPEAKFPDFIEDASDAVAWVFNNIKNYCNCDKIFVGGSSAGGYISMMLCFDKKYLAKNGLKPIDIQGYVHNAGQPTAHFNVLKERGYDSRRLIVDETAPLYFIGADGNDSSSMIFLVSDNDMENRFEQTMLTLSTLKHFKYDDNKIFSKVLHGGHCEHDDAVDENGVSVFGQIIEKFIKDHI